MNGEKETGVTTFFLKHEIDTGHVIFQEKIPIREQDNAGIIHDQLMLVGADLVLKTVKAIQQNKYPTIDQTALIDGNLKHAPKIFKHTCRINWSENIDVINNHIRGLSPYPAAWTEITIDGKTSSLKIFEANKEVIQHNTPVGMVNIEAKELKVAVTGGYIKINVLQLAGKKRLMAKDFLLGLKTTNSISVN